MAFDRTKPADTDYISASAANLRENFRALAEDTRLYGTGAPESSAGQNGWRYKDTNNGKEYIKINGAWIEKYSRPNLPIGSVIAFPVDTVPLHFLECNGATISRETYTELFAAIGTTYGEGDGSTTFNIPDFRDSFLRGAGGSNAEDIGVLQEDAIRNITGSLALHGGSSAGTPVLSVTGAFYASAILQKYGQTTSNSGSTSVASALFDASQVVPTALENRPVNYAVKFCIIYE